MKAKSGLLVLLLIVTLVFSACTTVAPQAPAEQETEEEAPAEEEVTESEPIRVAAVLPGRVDDGVFNQQMYEGLVALEEEMGDEVEVDWVENVYEVADIQPALRDYASQGYDLVIGHGFQFQDPIINLAPEFPDVNFAIGSGAFMRDENVSTYDGDNGEMGYALGTVAGLMTETNLIASVSGLEVPNVTAVNHGFELGAKAANPDVEVRVVYVGSFDDAEGAREAASALIDEGADVILSIMNNAATMGVTEERGAWGMLFGDLSETYPNSMLASTPYQFGVGVEQMVNDIQGDSFGNSHYELNFANGGLILVTRSDIPADKQAQIDDVIAALQDGSLEVPAPEVE